MARTKAELIAFADRQVGTKPYHPKPNEDLSGQCVTGVKVLLDFLGVPAPYSARGNAKDVGDTLIRQGIGTAGKGSILTVVVNRDMGYIGGVRYGHIWFDITGVANYESNGNRALYFTKNTRPLSQGQQFINLDKWIQGETKTMIIQNAENWFGRCNKTMYQIRGRALGREEFVKYAVGAEFLNWVEAVSDNAEADAATRWQEVGKVAVNDNWQKQIYDLQAQVKAMGSRPTQAQLDALTKQAAELKASTEVAEKKAAAAEERNKKLTEQAQIDYEAGKSIFRRIGIMLGLIKE